MREGAIKTIRAKLLAILLSIAIALTFAFSLGVQQVNAATGYSNEYPYLLNVDHSKVYNICINVSSDYESYYNGYGGINCLYEIKVFSGSYTHASEYDAIPRAAFTEITLDYDVNSPDFVLEDGTKVDDHTIMTNRDGMIRFKLPSYDYELSGDEYYNYPTNVYAPEVTVGLRGGDYTYLVGGRGYPARYGTSGPYVSLTKDAEKDDRNSWTKNWSRPLANYDPEEQELLKEIFEGYAKDLSAAVETETVPSKLPHGHDYFFKDPDIWKIPTSDQKRANEVTAMVNELPAVNELTLDDKSAVQAAKDAYDALTDKQKGFVEDATKTKLDDAVAKIAEL
ncbi:MAG: hypothetical protein IJI20_00795 [Firmicutes bacterium]|nr:hypothetical protein [Bacillota bacterium]